MTQETFEVLMQKAGDYNSQKDANIALNAVVNSIKQSLVHGVDVSLEGLANFMVAEERLPIKGPTRVPGYPKVEFVKNPYVIRTVKVKFDKAFSKKVEEDNR